MIRRGYVWSLRLLLVGLAVFGPSFMAFQLVSAAGNPAGQLRGGIVSKTLQLAQSTDPAGAGTIVDSPPITAVLYTKGSANVSWNGRAFAIDNGSYAYVGGERIDVAPASMGLLQLSDGGNVFVCAGSSVSITRKDNGAYALDVARGSARFSFATGTDFSVRANETMITADDSVTGAGGTFEGEVQARTDGGCLVCELGKRLKVQASGQGGGQSSAPSNAAVPSGGAAASQTSDSARIIEVLSTGAGSSVTATPIPAAAMPVSLSAGGTPAAAFLCQCEALKQRVEDTLASQLAQSSQPDATSTRAENAEEAVLPPEGVAVNDEAQSSLQTSERPDNTPTVAAPTEQPVAPPVAPPDAPPLALAEPNPPDPFDPNVLPPPAAGEPNDPVVVVAPPAVPASGSGGGGIASPS